MKNVIKTLPFTISLFFVLLWSYAAISKIIVFRNFRSQLGQSPGLEAYAGLVASGLIFLQLLAIGMICYRSYRLLGLWMTFGIVTVFTGYNGFILMDSNNLPCTCIGLFEKMTWKGNLNLNMGLMITALVGIISMKAGRSKMKK